jgi:hypothetical protein
MNAHIVNNLVSLSRCSDSILYDHNNKHVHNVLAVSAFSEIPIN